MAANDPIEPIQPDAPSRVVPIDVERVPTAQPARPTQPLPPTQQLADALERSLILDGTIADEPAAVGIRADLHDAAIRGNAYARAVEEANAQHDEQFPDPNSIGQVLGGAAAAAASGQAAQVDRTRARRDERTDHAEDVTSGLDPLAPTPRVTNDDEDDRQRRDQAGDDRSGQADPGSS